MAPRKVLILGAGGKSGLMAMKKMVDRPDDFEVTGAARTESSAKQVAEKTGGKTIVCDLTVPQSADGAMAGVETLVVLSSATPKPNYFKLFGQLCRKLCCLSSQMGKAFGYAKGGYPKDVDWEGGRAAIDAAKRAGVKHVIYVGSMGGTRPEHFLNTMGEGNILLWKRKAEMYLAESGLRYTIIHPGGLLPHHGNKTVKGGERELLVGLNDALMDNPAETRCIPREDLADVVVQCALDPAAIGAVFDLTSKDPLKIKDQKVWDKDIKTLLANLGKEKYDYSKPVHEILQP